MFVNDSKLWFARNAFRVVGYRYWKIITQIFDSSPLSSKMISVLKKTPVKILYGPLQTSAISVPTVTGPSRMCRLGSFVHALKLWIKIHRTRFYKIKQTVTNIAYNILYTLCISIKIHDPDNFSTQRVCVTLAHNAAPKFLTAKFWRARRLLGHGRGAGTTNSRANARHVASHES